MLQNEEIYYSYLIPSHYLVLQILRIENSFKAKQMKCSSEMLKKNETQFDEQYTVWFNGILYKEWIEKLICLPLPQDKIRKKND